MCWSVCVFVCADRLRAHTRRERLSWRSWSRVVGRDEICQIQGMWENLSSRVDLLVFWGLIAFPFLPHSSNSASSSKITSTAPWVRSSGRWALTRSAAASNVAVATGGVPGGAPPQVWGSPQLLVAPLVLVRPLSPAAATTFTDTSCVSAFQAGPEPSVTRRADGTSANPKYSVKEPSVSIQG